MKINLSQDVIKTLVLMLDDECQLIGDDEPCYDYIGIMKELVLGNKRRDANRMFEVNDETMTWLMSVLESRVSDLVDEKSKRTLSGSARKKLKERIDKEAGIVISI